ncbi:MAG: MlaD family protein [Phycisphaerae bacterium]
MPRKRHSEFLAGIFVVVAVLTTVGVLIWLGMAQVFVDEKRTVYFAAPQEAGAVGLAVGSPVKFGDASVGKIIEIRYSPEQQRVLYRASVDDEVLRVHTNGKAYVSAGMVQTSELIITDRGSADKPFADKDNPLPLPPGGVDRAMQNISQASEKLVSIASSVEKELDPQRSDSTLAGLKSVIGHLDDASRQIGSITKMVDSEIDGANDQSLVASLHRSAGNVEQITTSVRQETDPGQDGSMMATVKGVVGDAKAITADARPKISRTLTSVENTADKIETYANKDLAELLAQLRDANTTVLKITADMQSVTRQVDEIVTVNRQSIDETIDNMRQVSSNLKATAKEVRRNPWRLFHRPDDEEMHSTNIYDAARSFSEGAEQLDQALARLVVLRKSHPDGIPADDPTLTRIRKSLKETFSNFSRAEQALWKELTGEK